jgi:hypothetical protein
MLLATPAVAAPPGPLCGATLPHRGLFTGGFERPKIQHLASYCFNPDGLFTVVLDDGSIWRQWPGDVRYAYWRQTPSHYRVWMMGDDDNGFLTVMNDGLEYKVRRAG